MHACVQQLFPRNSECFSYNNFRICSDTFILLKAKIKASSKIILKVSWIST